MPLTEVIIDPKDDYDIRHWAAELGVHPLALRAVMSVVGTYLVDIRAHYGISDVVQFPVRTAAERKNRAGT